jgi:hypothetical protein
MSYYSFSKQGKKLFISRINLLKRRLNFTWWQDAHYILAGCSLQGGRMYSARWQDAKINPYIIKL